MVRRLSLGDIEDGSDPVEALNKALDVIVGFIEGRHGMIMPPYMIPPAELEEAVAWGRKLAETLPRRSVRSSRCGSRTVL